MSSSSTSPSFIQRLEAGPLKRYMGVEGGVLLRNRYAQQMMQRSPAFRRMNNALLAAPAWKWGLAIVPLYNAVTGVPSVDKLDINTSVALAATGMIWAYYGTLVKPKATALVAVSVALFLANGWNVYRRVAYELDQKKLRELGPASAGHVNASK